jgi:hypothetical protein
MSHEDAIKWLENLKQDIGQLRHEDLWPYAQAIDEIIATMEEQKHSETFIVIDNKTGKEADTYNIALHEDWAKHLCYCDMEGWAIEEDGTLLLVDECGRFAYADRERFKVKWE